MRSVGLRLGFVRPASEFAEDALQGGKGQMMMTEVEVEVWHTQLLRALRPLKVGLWYLPVETDPGCWLRENVKALLIGQGADQHWEIVPVSRCLVGSWRAADQD